MWVHILTNSLNRVLLSTPEKKHLYFVNECFFDTHVYTGDLDKSLEQQFKSNPSDFILRGSKIVYSPGENIDEYRKFVEYKQWSYYDILTKINLARVKEIEVCAGQDEVYKMKYDQAVLLRTHGYDANLVGLSNVQLVLDYAELDNCTAEQAADQIILQYTMHLEMMTKTEWFRIKYLRLLKAATTANEVKQVMDNLHKETFLNILL
jgi:hypothetical protein